MQENETRKEQNGDAPQDEVFSKSLSDNVKTLSPAQLVLKRFFRSKLSVVGLAVLLTLFLVCFIGPLFFPNMDYETPDLDGGLEVTTTRIEYTVDGVKYEMYDVVYTPVINKLSYPSAKHWLGTDENGRDVLMRLMYGGRISLTIGFVVVILETLVGVLLGGLAGYFGGVVDQIVMRIVDIFYCIPQMPILFICSALLSANQVNGYARIYWLMLILVVFGWAGTARMVRGQILSLREQEFMLAARSMGVPAWKKIFRHLIPNVMPQLIVQMTLGLGGIILTESTLSYLGLGVPIPYATWGNMIQTLSKPEILSAHFHVWGPPGICIMLAVLSFNFIGDGLRDAFDPKMKK
ncbi:MAG: ABC transporter permease [Clostridia bacterium]|jgi:peptide/nickel transport system permease protein|nr:ABC transporter permease [Clostridia bacterium]